MSWLEALARSATVLVPTALLDTQPWLHTWHQLHDALHPMQDWQHSFPRLGQLHKLPGPGRCLHPWGHWHRRRRPMTATEWHEPKFCHETSDDDEGGRDYGDDGGCGNDDNDDSDGGCGDDDGDETGDEDSDDDYIKGW